MTPGKTILNKGGVKEFLTCFDNDFQLNVTDQLGNIIVGEYALLEQINFELESIRPKNSLIDPNVTSVSDALSRTFQITDITQTYYRNNYLKLVNLTNIVKKKLLKLPYCNYLKDW